MSKSGKLTHWQLEMVLYININNLIQINNFSAVATIEGECLEQTNDSLNRLLDGSSFGWTKWMFFFLLSLSCPLMI